MTMKTSTFPRFSLALTGSALLAVGTAAGASAVEPAPQYTGSSDVWGCFAGTNATTDGPFSDGAENFFVLSALQKDGGIAEDRIEVRGSYDDGTIVDVPIDFTVSGGAVSLKGADVYDAVIGAGAQDQPAKLTVEVLVDGKIEASHVLVAQSAEQGEDQGPDSFRGCGDDAARGMVPSGWRVSEDGAPVGVAVADEGVEVVAGPAHGSVEKEEGTNAQYVYTPEPGFTGVDTLTFEYVNEDGDLVRKVVLVDAISSAEGLELGGLSDNYVITGKDLDGNPLPADWQWITVPAEELGADEVPVEDEVPAEDEKPSEDTPAEDGDEHEVPEKVETGAAPTSPWLLGVGALGAAGVAGVAARRAARTR